MYFHVHETLSYMGDFVIRTVLYCTTKVTIFRRNEKKIRKKMFEKGVSFGAKHDLDIDFFTRKMCNLIQTFWRSFLNIRNYSNFCLFKSMQFVIKLYIHSAAYMQHTLYTKLSYTILKFRKFRKIIEDIISENAEKF